MPTAPDGAPATSVLVRSVLRSTRERVGKREHHRDTDTDQERGVDQARDLDEGAHVFLRLRVSVRPDWREDERTLREIGLV